MHGPRATICSHCYPLYFVFCLHWIVWKPAATSVDFLNFWHFALSRCDPTADSLAKILSSNRHSQTDTQSPTQRTHNVWLFRFGANMRWRDGCCHRPQMLCNPKIQTHRFSTLFPLLSWAPHHCFDDLFIVQCASCDQQSTRLDVASVIFLLCPRTIKLICSMRCVSLKRLVCTQRTHSETDSSGSSSNNNK